ncbi:hypothetical protein D9M68_966850 [compost metagenome]
MPQLVSLIFECIDQMRMGMAQRIDCNACSKIKITVAAFGNQPDALTSLEAQSRTIIGVVERLHSRNVGHCSQASISLVNAAPPAKPVRQRFPLC